MGKRSDSIRTTQGKNGHSHPKALQQVLSKVRTALASVTVMDAKKRHEIGTLVLPVRNDEGDATRVRNRYGLRAVQVLADAIGWHRSTLYEYATVAQCWKTDEFASHLRRRDSHRGLPLTWSHFVELAKVMNKKERGALFERALANGWSVRELRSAIFDSGAMSEDDDAAEKITRQLASSRRQLDAFRAKLAKNVDRLPTETIPADTRAELERLEAQFQAVLRDLRQLLNRPTTKTTSRASGPKRSRGSARRRKQKASRVRSIAK